MNIAILGFAGQGKSAYEYWDQPGNKITICDAKIDVVVPDGAMAHLGPDYLKHLDEFDLLVRTPALHPRDIVAANPEVPNILDKVTTVTNEFFKVCPSKNIIGVTGTKGKGTASTLIAKMLEAAGKKVRLGGNIGVAPLDMLKNNIQPEDFVVLELANFQLIDLKYSPPLAVCLMVVPEHLDWHEDVNEYITAKQQLFANQTEKDRAIYLFESENSLKVVGVSKAQKIPYFAAPGAEVKDGQIVIDNQKICGVDELKLLGKHNWQNACAAVTAVWQITQNVEAIKSVLTTFEGLEHRLELVKEVGGVKYYDDSFGTTPETAMVAIEAFEEPKVVILGGSDKGADFSQLAQAVKANNVRSVITIGKMAEKIENVLKTVNFENFVAGGNTMSEIVNVAQSRALPGDVVLLSTACASFDMFNDYKDRGEQFQEAVEQLT